MVVYPSASMWIEYCHIRSFSCLGSVNATSPLFTALISSIETSSTGSCDARSARYSPKRIASSSLRIINPPCSLSHHPLYSLRTIEFATRLCLEFSSVGIFTRCISSTLPFLVVYCAGAIVYGALSWSLTCSLSCDIVGVSAFTGASARL